jgi:hypothetical protein
MTKLTTIATAVSLLLYPFSISGIDPRIIDETPMRIHQADNTPVYDPAIVQSELDSHRATWNSFAGESKNYDMTLERICFCPESYRGPFSIRVRNGEVQSATYLSETMMSSSVNPDLLQGLLTVDGVFDEIQKDLDRNYLEIRVTYDETTGHPGSFYSNMSRMVADGDRTYKISNVTLTDQ